MRIEGRESGLALIVTLLLGLIAAAFVGALMYTVSTGTWISGMQARYTSSLEAAKGGATFIQRQVSSWDLRCVDSGGNMCYCDSMTLETQNNGEEMRCSNASAFADTVSVDLGDMDTLGDYNLDANLTSMAHNASTQTTIFSFELTAVPDRNTEERSEIEFVYKVESSS